VLSIGDVIEVTAERMAYGGDAVARYEGLTVFVPLAAPGDRLRVRIAEMKKRFARAAIQEIISESPARRIPPCSYFGECGGCQLQHLSYDAQAEAKADFIRDSLARIAHIEWPHEITIKRAKEFQYRSRAQVKVEENIKSRQGDLRIGFNKAGSRAVCDVSDCPVLVPELNSALKTLRSNLKSARSRSHTKWPSEIEIAAGDSGVTVEPEIAGLGRREVERSVRGAIYRFSASTFFQVNPFLLDDLIDEAVKGAAGKLAIDLYAGVGLFTIQLARAFDRVIGIEADVESARFARANIKSNNVANAELHAERVESWLKQAAEEFEKRGFGSLDLVLLDPPRSGASEAIAPILTLEPERITYVACDPTTLARDLRRIIDSGYVIERLTALDLFPQTYHIEIVVSLAKAGRAIK
jgi:23S rRNA (uracil1939-C5)-methyltransferase